MWVFAPALDAVRDSSVLAGADAVERCSFASLLRFRLRLRRGPSAASASSREATSSPPAVASERSCVSVAAGEVTGWDARFWGGAPNPRTRAEVEAAMVAYMQREAVEDGTPWSAIARHMLGLHHGERGARLWRQIWSDHRRKSLPATEVAAQAAAVLADARADALASV